MSTIDSFVQSLQNKGKPVEKQQFAVELLRHVEEVRGNEPFTLMSVRQYCSEHIAGTSDAVNRIVVLFWYADFIGDKASGTYLITLLGTLGVMESQEKRLCELFGSEVAEKVFSGLAFPPLGSDLTAYPQAISAYLERLRELLSPAECQRVLAGNHHGINSDGFKEDKRLWLDSPDLETFLQQKHQRLVANLDEHASTGKLWFEQYISKEVVDYVKEHQEIQTGVLAGNRIITQKIPYNPDAWLKVTDSKMKRFYACHCPFVRLSIMQDKPVDDLRCYCSGGFTKLFFDYLFETDLEVELLESVLSGGETCKFAIKLPDSHRGS